ncbi:hypothetical protein [Methanoculleus chikugoensis]|nr:hypothetical protein [Methanoculleus chikugoensis]
MLDQFKGCLLGGAAIGGDALGMARESTPPDFQRLHEATAVPGGGTRTPG